MRLTATASWSAADEASHACSYDRVGAIGQHLICGRPARYIALAACLRIIAGMLSRVLGAALHSYESLVQRAALMYAQRWHSRLASEAWTGTTARKRLKKARLCAIRNSMTFTQNYGMRCCLKTAAVVARPRTLICFKRLEGTGRPWSSASRALVARQKQFSTTHV